MIVKLFIFCVAVVHASTKPERKQLDVELGKFATMFTCSASFAAVVAIAVRQYVSGGQAGSFSAKLDEWMSKGYSDVELAFTELSKESKKFTGHDPQPSFPVDETDCFPVRSKVGKIFSMSQPDVRVIAAAIRSVGLPMKSKSSKKRSGAQITSPAQYVGEVARVIASQFSSDQLQVAFVMAQVSDSMKEFKGKICKGTELLVSFANSIPEMSGDFGGNYLPTVFGFLRAAILCIQGSQPLETGLLQSNSGAILEKIEAILAAATSDGPKPNPSAQTPTSMTDFDRCAVSSIPNLVQRDPSQEDQELVKRFTNLEIFSRLEMSVVDIPVFETYGLPIPSDAPGVYIKRTRDSDRCASVSVVTAKYIVKVFFSSESPSIGTWVCDESALDEQEIEPADSALFRILSREHEQSVLLATLFYARSMTLSPRTRSITCSTSLQKSFKDNSVEISNAPWKDPRLQIRTALIFVPTPSSNNEPAKKIPDATSTATSITTAMFISSAIANQEKIFFTNFNNAAQQLSLLGIKAVGLATQIQAIRGHIMMLQLIDGHIAQLNADHDRYTRLLIDAHAKLAEATGR